VLPVTVLDLECNCAMGLFPEISRAWLTIDSVVYIWNYEDGKDLAYFDGLNQVVLCVGLATPKEGVFQPHIQYLLLLATAVEIVLLGVCFTGERGRSREVPWAQVSVHIYIYIYIHTYIHYTDIKLITLV